MFAPTEPPPATATDELPPLPVERWWGDPLGELRWQLELYRLLLDPVYRGTGVPPGDGRPVVLMPGFGAGDYTLLVLAEWLRRIGYAPRLCGFVANIGCSDSAVDRVERQLRKLNVTYGRRVALIGHSRGGHYARALGHRRPEFVSHAISIGAGLRRMLAVSYPTKAVASGVRHAMLGAGRVRSPRCFTDTCDCRFAHDYVGRFPRDRVRLTSSYSKGDGVVRWQSALVPYGTCVEVSGSHTGLIFNRKTYRAIATALAEPELPAEPVANQA